MPNPTEVPTPAALADLVARCNEMQRYSTELTAAEETRVAALASAIVTMRQVLELAPIPGDRLPLRQSRMEHWSLTGRSVEDAETLAIRNLHGALVLDEHGQIKVLSNRTWRGAWRNITLWRDGVGGLGANALMDYLARLVALAQRRAPDVARHLLERSEAVVSTYSLLPPGPRSSQAD
jgi:hypothetical protein